MVLRALNTATGQPVGIDQIGRSDIDRLRLETHQARTQGRRQLVCLDCTGSLHMVRTDTLDFFRHDPGQGLACSLAYGESPEHDAIKTAIAAAARALGWEAQVEVPGTIPDPRTGRPPFIDVVAWPDTSRRDEQGLAWEVQLSQSVDVIIWDRHTRRQNYRVCTWLSRGLPRWAARVPFMRLDSPPWELDHRPLVQVVRDQLEGRLVWTEQRQWAKRAPLLAPLTLDRFWTERAEAGRLSGHVVCRCPACGCLQMAAYRPQSTPWPRCRVCLAPGVLQPVSDPSTVLHKRPGMPRTVKRLLAAGGIYRPRAKGTTLAPATPQAPQAGPDPDIGPDDFDAWVRYLRSHPHVIDAGATDPRLNEPRPPAAKTPEGDAGRDVHHDDPTGSTDDHDAPPFEPRDEPAD